jgi:hypothetical protein
MRGMIAGLAKDPLKRAIDRLVDEGRLAKSDDWSENANKFVKNIVLPGTPAVPR